MLRVYQVESENHYNIDRVGHSGHNDGVNATQQPDGGFASYVKIEKFALAYHAADTSTARHYRSFSS